MYIIIPRPLIQCCMARKGCLQPCESRIMFIHAEYHGQAGEGFKLTMFTFHAVTRKVFKMLKPNL